MLRRRMTSIAVVLLAAGVAALAVQAGPADVTSRAWTLEGTFKTKIAFGPMGESEKGDATMSAWFGPADVTPMGPLAAGQFLLLIQSGEMLVPLQGVYELDEDGKPTLTIPPAVFIAMADQFELLLLAMLEEGGLPVAGASLDAEVEYVDIKCKPKAKDDGDKMKMKIKSKIDMVLHDPDMGSIPVTLKIKFKGKGVPVGP